ncbi:MAG: pepsin/retropepsin-like aspartic protease family protein [Chakrabartia sp.]
MAKTANYGQSCPHLLPAAQDHKNGKTSFFPSYGNKLKLASLVALTMAGASYAHASTPTHDACKMTKLKHSDTLFRVPFKIVDGRVYLQARVNGRGPFTFAIDTGASGMGRADASLTSTLSLQVDKKAKSSDGISTATVNLVHFNSLELGGFKRKDFDVITRDYNSGSPPESAISGIIARDFFADGLLIIDYPSQTLSFSRKRKLARGDKGVLEYTRPFRVPVSIGDMKTEGNLDTGANVTFVLPKSLFDKVTGSHLEEAGRGNLTNNKIETKRSTVHGPFQIGNISVSDVDVRVSDRFPELLIGSHVLQNFTVLIDQRSKSVALCKPSEVGHTNSDIP